MCNIDPSTLKIEIPGGYLVCEPHRESNFPGVWIYFSADGKQFSWDDLITVVEFNPSDNWIQTGMYTKGQEDCFANFCYDTGRMIFNNCEE